VAKNWIEEEEKGMRFGDLPLSTRFNRRLTDIDDLNRHSLPSISNGWRELITAYQLSANKNVKLERILSPHQIATLNRIRRCDVALIVQDSIQLSRETTEKTAEIKEKKTQRKLKHLSRRVSLLPRSEFA